MNAGQLAALIAAAFFAIGVCVGGVRAAQVRPADHSASTVLTGYSDATQALIGRAQAAVDRADEQLARTGALTESVEAVSESMSDLSEQVSAVAGSAQLIANGLGAPVLRFAAASYGVRRALALRRTGRPGRPSGLRSESCLGGIGCGRDAADGVAGRWRGAWRRGVPAA